LKAPIRTAIPDVPPRVLYVRTRFLLLLRAHFAALDELARVDADIADALDAAPRAIDPEAILAAVHGALSCFRAYGPTKGWRFHLFRARRFHDIGRGTIDDTLIAQLARQLRKEDVRALRCSPPWRVELIGQDAIDLGGPGRSAFTEICREFLLPTTGIFAPTPNGRRREGRNQDLLIPDPTPFAPGSFRSDALFFAGAFIGLTYFAENTFPFRFAPFVWSFLVGRPVTLRHIQAIDAEFARSLRSPDLLGCDGEVFSRLFASHFVAENAVGRAVELVPDGARLRVTGDVRPRYLRLVKELRVAEFRPALERLREGFTAVFPAETAALLRPAELRWVVCGSDDCPVEDLRRHCRVLHDPGKRAPLLWAVLGSFTAAERLAFIEFASGRSGLPPPGTNWDEPISIEFRAFARERVGNERLPTACTCHSTIVIPYYPDERVMAIKLRAAFAWAAPIADGWGWYYAL
jgi:hypothetical protein